MGNWASALAQGLGAAVHTGATAIGEQMKVQQQIEAEERAADLKLAVHERLAAADELMKNRVFERMSGYIRDARRVEVPKEAPTVASTGLTRESAADALSTRDYGTGPAPATGFAGDTSQLLKAAHGTLVNPNATAEQKDAAQGVIEQVRQQAEAQLRLNQQSVAGQTRPRTLTEARDAALDYALENDAPAYMAGTGMLAAAMRREDGDKKLSAERAEKELDRESLERRTVMTVDQRATAQAAETARKTEADAKRDVTNRARIETMAGGKGAKATALMQNVKMLEERGYPQETIDRFIFQTKDSSRMEKVFKLMRGPRNKFGDMKLDDAVKEVDDIEQAISAAQKGGKQVGTLPPGAKQVGTSGGRPVYETPDGKRFVQE